MSRLDKSSGQEALSRHLGGFVSEHKRRRIEWVLVRRTRFLTVVLEDIFQPHNASAVLRSCECFGVQDVHIVEGRNRFEVNKDVALGAGKWLSIARHGGEDGLQSCLGGLKERGYRLVAATPHGDDTELDDIAVDRPLAVLFGTEEAGLSQQALEAADEYLRIPMFGFTESFNISVSAALILRELTRRLRDSGAAWELADAERDELRLSWYRQVVRGSELIEERFWREA